MGRFHWPFFWRKVDISFVDFCRFSVIASQFHKLFTIKMVNNPEHSCKTMSYGVKHDSFACLLCINWSFPLKIQVRHKSFKNISFKIFIGILHLCSGKSLFKIIAIRPWSVDSLDGGFFTSQFGPVGRSGK